MSDNITVLNSTGGTITLRMKDTTGSSGPYANMSLPTDTAGNPMLVLGGSAVTSTMSAAVVALSSLSAPIVVGTVTSLSSGTVAISSITGGTITTVGTVNSISSGTITSLSSGLVAVSNGANVANVIAGSSAVTSTMAALVVVVSTNSNAVLGTGTPTTPSSQYISAVVVGDVTQGSSASSTPNPVNIGGTAIIGTNPTAVSSFQRVGAFYDPLGKQVTLNSARGLKANQITFISSTTETVVVTASSLVFNDVYGCIVANPSSQQVTVLVKDSSGGTTQFEIVCPSGDTRGFLGTESAAFKQTTSSAAWTATLSVAASSVAVTMMFVKNTA